MYISILKRCQIIRCLFLFEKAAALNYIYDFEDKKLTTNLFPTTKLIERFTNKEFERFFNKQ